MLLQSREFKRLKKIQDAIDEKAAAIQAREDRAAIREAEQRREAEAMAIREAEQKRHAETLENLHLARAAHTKGLSGAINALMKMIPPELQEAAKKAMMDAHKAAEPINKAQPK